jgi:hypothetical protein
MITKLTTAGVFVVMLVAVLCSATVASAETCTVNDPTGTPLNVRAQPDKGRLLGALNNGTTVLVRETKGKWARVVPMIDNAKDGWVFKEYLSCDQLDSRQHFELLCGEITVSVERLDASGGSYEVAFQNVSHKKPIDLHFQWKSSGGYLNGKQCKELRDGP